MKFTLKLDVATQVLSLDSYSRDAIDWFAADHRRAAIVHRIMMEMLAECPKLEIVDAPMRRLALEAMVRIAHVFPGETFEIEPLSVQEQELVWRDRSPLPAGYRK